MNANDNVELLLADELGIEESDDSLSDAPAESNSENQSSDDEFDVDEKSDDRTSSFFKFCIFYNF